MKNKLILVGAIISVCTTVAANEVNKFGSQGEYSWNFKTPAERQVDMQRHNFGRQSGGGVIGLPRVSGTASASGTAQAIGNNVTVNVNINGDGNSISQNAINFDGANLVNNDTSVTANSKVIESYNETSSNTTTNRTVNTGTVNVLVEGATIFKGDKK